MKFESKYNLGDVVFYAGYDSAPCSEPCPDCLGEKVWTATLPSGEVLTVDCPTCGVGYFSTGKANKNVYVPRVRSLTIGQVGYEPGPGEYSGFRYMCHETGIGTGTIHYEVSLFETPYLAEAAAIRLAAEAQANSDRHLAVQREKNRKKLNKVWCPNCGGSGYRKSVA